MKKIFLILSTFLIATGCQNKTSQLITPDLPPAVAELQDQEVPEMEEQSSVKGDTVTHHGSWFDIKYPKEFIASPASGKTDEARFVSADGAVEFFIFSPLWGGDPIDYLKVAANEKLVNEKVEENGAELKKQIIRWVTVKAKDGSYYRSFVSIKSQVDTGSDIHKVFGIKYKDNAAYEKYKADYLAFKKSLQQYAD